MLLSQNFVQPVRFVTYTGIRDLTKIEIFPERIKGLDLQGAEVKKEYGCAKVVSKKDLLSPRKNYHQ